MTVGDFRENGKFEKTGNWARIHQRFGKTSIEVSKTEILTNGYYNKKMANVGENGTFRQKWRVCQTFIKGLTKYSNKMTKKDILTNSDFTKMTNLGKNLFKVWQKLKQDHKRGMSIIVGFTKMTYFAKPANLARTETMKQQNRHIDRWRFTQKWQI